MVYAKLSILTERDVLFHFISSPMPEKAKMKVTQVKIEYLATRLRHWGDSVVNHPKTDT